MQTQIYWRWSGWQVPNAFLRLTSSVVGSVALRVYFLEFLFFFVAVANSWFPTGEMFISALYAVDSVVSGRVAVLVLSLHAYFDGLTA